MNKPNPSYSTLELTVTLGYFQLSFDDIHVIGWSLGGQLVAFIGQEADGEIARITALDPAGVYFGDYLIVLKL